MSAGWIEIVDVETGRGADDLAPRLCAARPTGRGTGRIEIRRQAKELGLDVVSIGLDQAKADLALSEFVVERRLRKINA